jgi:hypothetical protein
MIFPTIATKPGAPCLASETRACGVESHTSAAKAASYRDFYGTAEAVPFHQTKPSIIVIPTVAKRSGGICISLSLPPSHQKLWSHKKELNG